MWIFFAFLAPAFYSIAEVFDNFLANKKFKKLLTLVFYTSLFNLIFIPVLFLFDPPQIPPLDTLPIFVILGFISIGYLYPYYKGLQSDDTSIAISFFAIGRLFIPVLAFLIVGEVLDLVQYIGIALIVTSVIALGLHHTKAKFRFSKAIWHIGLAAFILAFEGVLFKLLFDDGVSVSTAIGGEAAIALILALSLLAFHRVRHDIKASLPTFIRLSPLFLLEEMLTFFGLAAEAYAISLTSVSVVKGITMISPFYLLIFAWLGRGLFPSVFKEDLHKGHLLKKILFFAILLSGVILLRE
ncbi:MAG: EamA family transporter [Candidatus Paceibacterota bacterium]